MEIKRALKEEIKSASKKGMETERKDLTAKYAKREHAKSAKH
jgi:hypothetical protein